MSTQTGPDSFRSNADLIAHAALVVVSKPAVQGVEAGHAARSSWFRVFETLQVTSSRLPNVLRGVASICRINELNLFEY